MYPVTRALTKVSLCPSAQTSKNRPLIRCLRVSLTHPAHQFQDPRFPRLTPLQANGGAHELPPHEKTPRRASRDPDSPLLFLQSCGGQLGLAQSSPPLIACYKNCRLTPPGRPCQSPKNGLHAVLWTSPKRPSVLNSTPLPRTADDTLHGANAARSLELPPVSSARAHARTMEPTRLAFSSRLLCHQRASRRAKTSHRT